MCDEYEDERLRAFWRQLAIRDELGKLEPAPEPADESVVKPVGEIVEPTRAKPRALRH